MAVALLAVAVAGVFVRPRRVPAWAAPVAAALATVGFGVLSISEARHAVQPLVAPLLFLLAAVPLATLLDRLGFFSSAAALVDGGRHLEFGLWWFAAAVTTLFNLDAAVVLLTPLYVQIARRHGIEPAALAIQPVILAMLASSALPVSNLTNLVVASRLHLHATSFIAHLGPASLVAVTVGWFAYARATRTAATKPGVRDAVDRRALWRGAPVVAFVLIGFVFGDTVHVQPWIVAVIAIVMLLPMVPDRRGLGLPLGAAALALGLGVVTAAAAPHLPITSLLDGHGVIGDLRAAIAAIVGANLVNNLPAILVALPHLVGRGDRVWPVLLGVNMGPALVITGALAGLLWRDTAARIGVRFSAWQYTKTGLLVALPAIVAAVAVQLLTNAVLR